MTVRQSLLALSGVVIDEVTGEPVDGADIWIALPGNALFPSSLALPGRGRSPRARTDSAGNFRLEGLEEDTYYIGATADGYAAMAYGSRVPGRTGIALNPYLTSITSVAIRLPRLAYISGVIHDSSDAPLASVSVILLQRMLTVDGLRLIQVAESQTDSRGGFAFTEVLPHSRYYVVAGRPSEDSASIEPQEAVHLYPWTFYPGVPDANAAVPIDVLPAMRLSSINIALEEATTHVMSGTLVDVGTGEVPSGASVVLHSLTPFSTPGATPQRQCEYSEADGTFRVPRLVDGRYAISVSLDDRSSNARRQLSSFVQEFIAGALYDNWVTVTLSGSDVDLAIRARQPGSFRGRIVTPDKFGDLSESGLSALEGPNLTVGLRATERSQAPVFPVPVQALDGTFTVTGALEGEYRLSVSGLPPGFYISRTRFNGAVLSDLLLDVPAETSNSLDIVVEFGAGTVLGRVEDDRNDAVPAAVGLLLPDPLPRRVGYFRFFVADAAGSFVLRDVPPGDYQVFAFGDLRESELPDPAAIRRTRAQSRRVSLGDSTEGFVVVPLSAIGDAGYSGIL